MFCFIDSWLLKTAAVSQNCFSNCSFFLLLFFFLMSFLLEAEILESSRHFVISISRIPGFVFENPKHLRACLCTTCFFCILFPQWFRLMLKMEIEDFIIYNFSLCCLLWQNILHAERRSFYRLIKTAENGSLPVVSETAFAKTGEKTLSCQKMKPAKNVN